MSLDPAHGDVYSISLCDKLCQWLSVGLWFSLGSSGYTNKTDCQDITEI